MLTRRNKNFVWRRVDARRLDLKGMKVAIVGGTGGIGRAFSRFLASRGASVLAIGQTFRDSDMPGIEFFKADLSLMREAQRIGSLLPAETLDLVIFTNGIMAAPKRQETAEEIERDMAVSYLSRLVMVREIASRLGKNRPAASMKPRVFIMGFPGTGQIGKLDDLNGERSYSWGIPCSGKQVYTARQRAEWLEKIREPGVRRRAEIYYQELDGLRLLRLEVRKDLLAESNKHQVWKRLCGIPSIGAIRAAVLLGIMQTAHRFRTKRQLWTYSGLGVEGHSSADHQVVKGQLQRRKKAIEIRRCRHFARSDRSPIQKYGV